MSTAMTERPQVASRRLADKSARYSADGTLWVKHDGDWMTHTRYVARVHAERFGASIPSGHRVIVVNPAAPVVPANLAVKPRGRAPIPLREFISGTTRATVDAKVNSGG